MTPQQIRALRASLGETQVEFGQRFMAAPATVADWEQGRHKPNKLAQLLMESLAQKQQPGKPQNRP